MSGGYKYIGKSIAKVDAELKAKGLAKYTFDMFEPGMAHGRILRSTVAHAVIKRIDITQAIRLKGVHAVLTGKDLNDRAHGPGLRDLHILAKDIVRYVGEPVAAVSAETEELADLALKSIFVEYEELPAEMDVEESFKENPSVIIHPNLKNYDHAPKCFPRFIDERPNVFNHHIIQSGDLVKGFAEADHIIENKYTVGRIQHCALEPHCAVVEFEENDRVLIYSTTNMKYAQKNMFCHAFNLPHSKVRLIVPNSGGSFGGKLGITAIGVAYALTRETGLKTKVAFSREEVFIGGVTRHPFVIYIKDGINKDGKLLARDITAIQNSGAYAENGFVTVRNACFAAVGSYKIPNLRIRSYGVYTNQPVAGAFRGFGNIQVLWAIESQMDMLAEKAGISPADFRRLNLLQEGDLNPAKEKVHCIGAMECLDKVLNIYDEPGLNESPYPYIKKGIGYAVGNKYSFAPTISSSVVKIYEDGRIEARVGSDDVGQGMRTVMTQIVAEEFDIDVSQVDVLSDDTLYCPYDEGSVSSRVTYNLGNAVLLACRDAKKQIIDKAAKIMNSDPSLLEIKDGMVYQTGASLDKSIKITDLFNINYLGTGCFLPEGGEILGKATWIQAATPEDPQNGTGERLTSFYTHGAQSVEVAVDTCTGNVTIEKVYCAFDAGRAVNPQLCEGQIEGGVCMGMSSTLLEEMVINDGGRTVNSNFTDYLLATTTDLPMNDDNKVFIVEIPHQDGPFGAKGMGEATMAPSAAAISNAIYNAVGIRLYDLPIKAETVLRLIREKSQQSGEE